MTANPENIPPQIPPKTQLQAVVPIAMLIAVMLALPMGMIGWGIRGWQEERKARDQAAAQAAETGNGAGEADVALRRALEEAMAGYWDAPTLEPGEGLLSRLEVALSAAEMDAAIASMRQLRKEFPASILELTTEGQDAPVASFLISGEKQGEILQKLGILNDLSPQNTHGQQLILDLVEK
jgi:hypothetical protein